jgi:hypothetical protein
LAIAGRKSDASDNFLEVKVALRVLLWSATQLETSTAVTQADEP